MAGFNFKKLTKDKHKNQRSASGDTKEATGVSPSKFLHFNLNHDNGRQQDDLRAPQQQQQAFHSNNMSMPNQMAPPVPAKNSVDEEDRPYDPNLQQSQRMYTAQQPRVFPTPQPSNQRNVSGATQLMQLQQEHQRQQQAQQQPQQEPSMPQNGNTPPHVRSPHTPMTNPQHSTTYESSKPEKKTIPQLVNDTTTTNSVNNHIWNRIKLKNSPFPRYRHVASSYATDDDRVFVIGGLHDQSVFGDIWIIKSLKNGDKFESTTIDITENTPPPRVGHAATLCGNAFVVFGGDTHKVNKDGLMDDDLYLFNINSYKWTIPNPVGPRPMGRYGHKISIIATTPMKTKLYLFGGQFDDTYFNNLAVFDLSSFRRSDSHWEFLKPKTFIPPPLTNHTMVSYDSKLWVFGGDTLQGLVNKVFMYDPEVNDWCIIDAYAASDDIENIPPPMQEHAAIMYGHLMCIIGGKDELDNYLNTVYFLNLITFKWYKLPFSSVGIPQGRSGHSITLLKNNKLLIMGGDKFDYARPDEVDLHTSETDMGNGTILYTLDLSTLKELCPDIMNKVASIRVNGNEDNKESQAENSPSTPLVVNKEFPISQRNISPSSVTTNGTIPKDFNRLPELAAQNILTPYTAPETQKTPKIDGDETFDDEHHTPIAQSMTPQTTSQTGHELEQLHKVTTPGSRDQTFEDSELHDKTPEIETATRTPVKNGQSFNVNESPVKINDDLVNDIKNEDYDADLAEEYEADSLADLSAVREFELEENQHNASKLKHSPFTEFNQVDNIDIQNDNLKADSPSTPPHSSRTPLSFKTTETPLAIPSNMIQVDREVFNELRSELHHLKELANDKANEASKHILGLEKENEELKKSLKDRSGLANGLGGDFSDENAKLTDQVHALEGLLNEKFLDLDTLNSIVRKQNTTIDRLMSDENYKEKYNSLEKNFQLISEENEELKDKLRQYDSDFNTNIRSYSEQMELLLTKWKGEQFAISTKDDTNNASNKSYNKFSLDSPHHKDVVTKLSNQLDDLLVKSQDLSHSRDMLDAEYHQLEKRHRSLSQDLLSHQPVDEIEDDDAKNDLDTTEKAKTLYLAQEELEKFREKNKALQDEIEQLKSSMN